MIEPQRDLHKAQNPGVLVSDPTEFVVNGIFLVRIFAPARSRDPPIVPYRGHLAQAL
jgi:hypothetical protein